MKNGTLKTVQAFAPATVTNVSCGFDIMGFALETPGDTVKLQLNGTREVRIVEITPASLSLPRDPAQNTAGKAILAMLQALNVTIGIDISIRKQLGIGTGLGSSAASAAAAVVALNVLLGEPLSRQELIPFAVAGEAVSSGSAVHIDNVAASLMGGFVVVRQVRPPDILAIPYPKDLYCAVLHPHLELKTADMRAILHQHIPLSQAVAQWGNIAGLIVGLIQADYALIARSLTDVIVEPIRGQVIPGFSAAQKAALDAGALGSGISGSGPSIFALAVGKQAAQYCGATMQNVYEQLGINSDVFVSAINPRGAIVTEKDG